MSTRDVGQLRYGQRSYDVLEVFAFIHQTLCRKPS